MAKKPRPKPTREEALRIMDDLYRVAGAMYRIRDRGPLLLAARALDRLTEKPKTESIASIVRNRRGAAWTKPGCKPAARNAQNETQPDMLYEFEKSSRKAA